MVRRMLPCFFRSSLILEGFGMEASVKRSFHTFQDRSHPTVVSEEHRPILCKRNCQQQLSFTGLSPSRTPMSPSTDTTVTYKDTKRSHLELQATIDSRNKDMSYATHNSLHPRFLSTLGLRM